MNVLLINLITNFGIGIISGLVTAFLILIFRGWWLGILLPWYEERVYKDSRVDKTWFAYSPFSHSTEIEELQWEIKQVAHKLSGTVICLNGRDKGKIYDVEGTFQNLILTAVYRSTDRRDLDRGTLTLMLINNGQTLKGHCAYYSASRNEIEDAPYECDRTKRIPTA